MNLSPSSIASLSQPSKCERRTWLKDVEKLKPAPNDGFAEFIIEQGLRHEAEVLERLRADFSKLDVVDLGPLKHPEAVKRTSELVAQGDTLIYQAHFESQASVEGEEVTLVGYPDFLIPEGGGWIIGDAKLVRSIHKQGNDGTLKEKSDKKAIFHQLRLYGWLFEQSFPGIPFQLRVYNGSGEIETVDYKGAIEPFSELARVLAIRKLESEPSELVGWTKCNPCGFRERCWPRAVEDEELGYIVDITAGLGKRLLDAGYNSYPEVRKQLDERQLAGIKSPSAGPDNQSNRDGARRILENIEAVESGQSIRRKDSNGDLIKIAASVSSDENYVMFDLEGLPPDRDEAEKVYLWGMQVFGRDKGDFIAALADFGVEGDRNGWEEFLRQSRSLLLDNPGIRFVHWHSYEKTRINQYIKRFRDDSHGTASDVLDALLDLLPITKAAVAVPAPSYSLKVIEKLSEVKAISGFARTADEVAKGDDSIAAYIEAIETNDMARRTEIVDAILAYNQEDLEATWAVQLWLQQLAGK